MKAKVAIALTLLVSLPGCMAGLERASDGGRQGATAHAAGGGGGGTPPSEGGRQGRPHPGSAGR